MSKAKHEELGKQIEANETDVPVTANQPAATATEADTDAPIDIPDAPVDADVPAPTVAETGTDAPTATAVNSMRFGKAKPASNEPVYVTRVIDGVEKKFRIRGKNFHIKGIDYTAEDLAANVELIDAFIAKNSGMLEEVFE